MSRKSRFIILVILSAVLFTGCSQMGILPHSNLPIIGGGEKFMGHNCVIHMKEGGEIRGLTYYDSRTDTYNVYSTLWQAHHGNPSHTIPKDQVSYVESH